MQLNKQQCVIALATADPKIRPNIAQVHIRDGRLEACNSFVLATCPAPADAATDTYLDAASMQRVKKLKKGETANIPQVDVASPYPNTEQLVPTTPPTTLISLGVPHLKLLVKLAESADADAIRFAIREKEAPVEYQAGDIVGLVMPCFCDWNRTPWLSRKHWDQPKEAPKPAQE